MSEDVQEHLAKAYKSLGSLGDFSNITDWTQFYHESARRNSNLTTEVNWFSRKAEDSILTVNRLYMIIAFLVIVLVFAGIALFYLLRDEYRQAQLKKKGKLTMPI